MRVVIQRVLEAAVRVDGSVVGEISKGILLLVGIVEEDTIEDIEWLTNKIVAMRIFDDENGVMNLSVKDINGELLVVSQFTLMASTKKGNRPSYIKAAPPAVSIPLFETFKQVVKDKLGKPIQAGEFGADMKVSLINDGPVTIIIDSKIKE